MGLSLLFGLLVVVFFDLCNFLSETGTWYLFHYLFFIIIWKSQKKSLYLQTETKHSKI